MLAVLEVADQGLGHLDMNWVVLFPVLSDTQLGNFTYFSCSRIGSLIVWFYVELFGFSDVVRFCCWDCIF